MNNLATNRSTSIYSYDTCVVFSRRFSSTVGMSEDELERRRVYTRILEYEQDNVHIFYGFCLKQYWYIPYLFKYKPRDL